MYIYILGDFMRNERFTIKHNNFGHEGDLSFNPLPWQMLFVGQMTFPSLNKQAPLMIKSLNICCKHNQYWDLLPNQMITWYFL